MKFSRTTKIKIGRIRRAIRNTTITVGNYWEFTTAVLAYGVCGIYALYVYSRTPIYLVEVNTYSPYLMANMIVSGDIAGLFYYLTPTFEVISLVTLMGLVLVYITKLAKHALRFNAPPTDIQARIDGVYKPVRRGAQG